MIGVIGSGAAHEVTRGGFERTLDPHETLALAGGGSLRRALAAAAETNATARLSLELVDAETKQPVAGLVRITPADGRPLALPGLISRGLKLRANHPAKDWHVMTEAAVMDVPPALLRIEAFGGLETELAAVTVDLRGCGEGRVVLPLRRFFDAARAGWRSGNTHLHLRGLTREQANEYLRSIPRGDALDLVFVSHLERAGADHDYVTNAYTPASLAKLARPGLMFGYGEEHRHNFGAGGEGYGHVLFLDLPILIQPVSIGSGIAGKGPDYPPLRRGIDQARQVGATIVWCHNAFGFEHVPNWLAGRIHAMNIFDGGTQGSYVQTYYRFLDLGMKVPFSTGTDWFMYDFSRVYVRLDTPFTTGAWLKGLEEGRTFISNGPLLELDVADRQIGETVTLTAAGRVRVRARAAGRADFQGLELVHDGRTVAQAASRPNGGHHVAELDHLLDVRESGWVAARTPGGALDAGGLAALPPNIAFRPRGTGRNEMGEALFAHTSPVYLSVGNRRLFRREAAEALRTDMEASRRAIASRARFETDPQRSEVLDIYEQAIAELRRAVEGGSRD